ncbi:MAG TPA: ornithine carbamoyltransferase [Actinomycetota bacterium]|nr:ornithine carbamoyltransferase [Actinomycetota bacterium]
MTERDFLSIDDLDTGELDELLDRAAKMKADRKPSKALAGKTIAMVFEKPSTRTRISFEVGIAELGAHALPLSSAELQLGRGETIEDTGRVLSRYVHGVVVRTFEQERLERLADAATIPVINALSDLEHPCQALADLLTIREVKGKLNGVKLTYVGDGNNVAHSLLLAGALAGMDVAVATPPGYEPIPQIAKRAAEIAEATGGSVEVTTDAVAAVTGTDVVYTDVWASMGQEREAEERRLIFAPYQVNPVLLARAADGAIVLHCLPAHRGEEIADEVIDGPHSFVWDQAENRLHTQKALMEWLIR